MHWNRSLLHPFETPCWALKNTATNFALYLNPIWLWWSENCKDWNGNEVQVEVVIADQLVQTWKHDDNEGLSGRKPVADQLAWFGLVWFGFVRLGLVWERGWGWVVFASRGNQVQINSCPAAGAALARGSTCMHTWYTGDGVYIWYSWHAWSLFGTVGSI